MRKHPRAGTTTLTPESGLTVSVFALNWGASFSVRKHLYRAEHWSVVKGAAEVACIDQIEILAENELTYIRLDEVHRLANSGNFPPETFEVHPVGLSERRRVCRFRIHLWKGKIAVIFEIELACGIQDLTPK